MTKRSRREFLRTVVVSAGAASMGSSVLVACGDDTPARPTAEVFPQSVASGDPRADSIVLWTRAVPEDETTDAMVTLEVGTDAELTSLLTLDVSALSARADHDHCVRVKVTGLSAGTTYWYRFVSEGTPTNTGRFRTAAAADADVPVRLALLSCQDRVGRYYNTLLRLLDDAHDDLDFVVHVGDYVYETTGDPGFMMTDSGRGVGLRAPEEAVQMGSGGGEFFAARSVSNYRDLYRAYRSDEILQRVHEKFAFVCTWDDHEFSDDCWGANGTYTDGVLDELDVERRVNSEQVYLEYMPIARDADGDGALQVDAASLYPDNTIYRDFRFGRHVTMAVTDYRSFRPDHPTPEDAFPGKVLLDEAQTRAVLARQEADGELPDGVDADMAFDRGGFRTYVDLEDAAFADHKQALTILLTGGYAAEGIDMERAQALAVQYAAGAVDAEILQATIDAGRDALPAELRSVSDVDPEDPTLERGVPYALTGKTGLVGQLGARYLVVQRTYDLVQAHRARIEGETSFDDVLGADQEAWLRGVLSGSDATWNVVANSVCNTSLVLDLSGFAGGLPPGLPAERFYLNVDQWDGFPERRRKLMDEVYRPANAVLLAGDIHAGYGSDFGADAEGNRVVEVTTSSVSSGTFRELLYNTGSRNEAIAGSGLLDPVTEAIDNFMQMAFEPLKVAHSNKNGVTVLTFDAGQLRVDWHLIPEERVSESFYERPEDIEWIVTSWTVEKDAGRNGPLTEV
ncbi:MAG TPA: hypothetical protein DEF51_22045 [Myxococcales bacterium]|nr:hypothetical protein [Myxococcales bacterium]